MNLIDTDPFEVPMCEAGVVMEVAQTLGCPMQLFVVFRSREWREL